MDKDKFGRLASLITNLSVLAGIIFVGIEIGQNNELMRSEARYNRAQNRLDANFLIMGTPDVISAITKLRAGEPVTAEQEFVMSRMAIANFVAWQLTYQDYDAGLLDSGDMPIEGWKSTMDSRIYQGAWDDFSKTNLRPDFVEWFESRVIDR